MQKPKLDWPVMLITKTKLKNLIEEATSEGANAFFQANKERYPDNNERLNEEATFGEYDELRKHLEFRLSKEEKITKKEVTQLLMSAFDSPFSTDLSFDSLNLLQDACWSKYANDPLIFGIIENLVDYIIGTGVVISTPIPEMNNILEEFRRINKMALREREMVRACLLDGEFFALLFSNNSGQVYLRKGHPSTIRGIETNPGDIETTYSYYQEFSKYDSNGSSLGMLNKRYLKDLDYDSVIKLGIFNERSIHEYEFDRNVVCKMIKLNDADKLRGLPILLRVLKYAKIYENFLMDRMTLNHERSKVVWIKSIIGRASETLKRMLNSPRGGTMLIESEGIKYRTEKPNLDSSEAKEDGLNLLYYIGSGVRFPLHILNQRTDQQVYASIKKADSPFARMIDSYQMFFATHLEEIYRFVIKKNIAAGKLKKEYSYPAYDEDAIVMSAEHIAKNLKKDNSNNQEIINEVKAMLEDKVELISRKTEEIPISFDFPQFLLQDPKEMADVLKIHNDMEIASRATLAAKAGYNWKRERIRILDEKETFKTEEPEVEPKEDTPKDTKPEE